MELPAGEVVHGEVSSADASTTASITLYGVPPQNGATSRPVRALAANERLVITDVTLQVGAALTVSVFTDENGDGSVNAGERIVAGAFAANSGTVVQLATPHYCKTGVAPKIKSSGAGQVDCIVRGRIING